MKYLLGMLLLTSPALSQNARAWDTLYYEGFQSRLIIGVFQCYREFNNEFTEKHVRDPRGLAQSLYQAESNNITGLMINYDKIILQVGLRSTPRALDPNKGKTETFIAQLNIGGNKWFLENSYRYFKGFYDDNTDRHTPRKNNNGRYFRQPTMVNTLLSNRFIYFTNHKKFAYRAAYYGNFRQLKSAATWVYSVHSKVFGLHADSSFFARPTWPLFGEDAPLKGLNVTSVGLNAGAAVTIVLLKSFFFNGTFIAGPEIQWRRYDYGEHRSDLTYVGASGSIRIAFGINFRRCFYSVTSVNDFSVYNSNTLAVTNKSLTAQVTFGWRFNIKTPGFYERFQETGLYKSL